MIVSGLRFRYPVLSCDVVHIGWRKRSMRGDVFGVLLSGIPGFPVVGKLLLSVELYRKLAILSCTCDGR